MKTTRSSALAIDNDGEFPTGRSHLQSSWSDVYKQVDALSVGVSHVRVLVPDKAAAKKLLTSCFVRYGRISVHLETRTVPCDDGVYVYIRKTEKQQ